MSYLFSPETLLQELHRILKPGGTLLLSSMRPDSDVSLIFTDYVRSARDETSGGAAPCGGDARESALCAARSMLNEAASLFELEEEGVFRFYSAEELSGMLEACGFTSIRTQAALGTPPQAVIAVGKKL
jgi:ubiquinone/menaquinone biosynthesis C-methylase UbiE